MTQSIEVDTAAGPVRGHCDAAFSAVADAFVANFEQRDEVGASCVVNVEGTRVVDIWGGRTTRDGEQWNEDTVCTVFSSTKGAMALCAHMLADRGALDLDALVTDYWPEFGQGGKESARVKMTLDHSVGVPHVRAPVEPGAFYDYDAMVRRVEQEAAFW